MLRLNQVRIRNIMGIREVDIEGDDVVVVRGPNGSGKSSIVKAFEMLLKGGHNSEVVQIGEKDYEVFALVENGWTIRKKGTSDKSPPAVVKDQDGMNVKRPNEWIRQQFDIMSINPVEIILADKAQRVKMIAEGLSEPLSQFNLDPRIKRFFNLQVEVRLGDIFDIRRSADSEQINVRMGPNSPGIKVLGDMIAHAYEWRRNVNRERTANEATGRQLRSTLPANIGDIETTDAVKERQAVLTEKLGNIAQREAEEIAKARTEYEVETKNLVETLQAEMTDIDSKLAALDETRRELAAQRNALANNLAETKNRQARLFASKEEAIAANYKAEKAEINAEQEGITDDLERASSQQNTLELVKGYQHTQRSLNEKHAGLDEAVTALRETQADLLGSLDIEGVRIADDGEITVNDVRWDMLNTAMKMRIAFSLLALRGGKLAIVDGAERLDRSAKVAMFEEAKRNNIQLVLTEVGGDTLNIDSNPYDVAIQDAGTA